MARLDDLLGRLNRLAAWACHGLLAVIVAVTVLQVALRFGFNRPTSWSEEVALLCLIWFGMLAVAIGVHGHGHIAITVIRDRLAPKAAAVLDYAAQLLVLGFMVVLLLQGGDLVALAGEQLLPASRLPKTWLYLPVLVGAGLGCLNAAGNLLTGRVNGPRGNLDGR